MNPEDTSKTKDAKEKAGKNNEKDLSADASGGDLDVFGSELDDRSTQADREAMMNSAPR